METPNSLLPLFILILPLIGFLFNGVIYPLFHKGFARTSANLAGFTATIFIATGFVLAVSSFMDLLTQVKETPYLLDLS